jgi:hypothetical protein
LVTPTLSDGSDFRRCHLAWGDTLPIILRVERTSEVLPFLEGVVVAQQNWVPIAGGGELSATVHLSLETAAGASSRAKQLNEDLPKPLDIMRSCQ